MNPGIFAIISSAGAVTAILGSNPTRFWPFGEAPQKPVKPYAVWQTAYGSPENKLDGVPDLDRWGVQIDCYASTPAGSRDAAEALRDALEPLAYVVAWNGEFTEGETKLARYSFTVEFMTSR